MILSNRTLFKMLEVDTLSVTPLDKEQVQPASMDIRLGNIFSIVEDLSTGVVTLEDEIRCKTINTNTYILPPGQFAFAITMEHAPLPGNLAVFVEGRSSLGHLGLFIQNVGWVDPGFQGEITLELSNANRCAIELKTGRKVGWFMFVEMDDTVLKPYSGKCQGQKGVTGSRVYMD